MIHQDFSKGVAFMLVSATGLSLIGLFGKIFEGDVSLSALVFFRFISAFFICLLFYFFIGEFKSKHKNLAILPNVIRAFCVLASQYSFYYYIQHSSLMNGMALLNTGPMFIPVIERMLVGSRIGSSTWISILVSFIGVLFILQPDSGIFSLTGLIGLSAGVFQAISQVMFGMNAKAENIELSVLITFGLCSVIGLIPYLIFNKSLQVPLPDIKIFILLILGLGVASLLNQFARAKAYRFSSPSRLAAFLYFSVILAGIYDWLIFKDPLNFLSCLGIFIIILGGVLKIVLRKKILQSSEKKTPFP
ncbi:MAG: DMT family transporter [Chlamydiae bacterium]|nr:DMT family transporter [Chlamydiota bacterium]